ncbi:MAG: T9SS type A sorting domain-containing protein [candidate division Zixibacteria bacterium]|nr:T9SS type A sorting domain-containing protein [candidate division Zixibacteria bacterium]
MRQIVTTLICGMLIIATACWAQAIEVEGEVSGVWMADNNPYEVIGDLTIPTDSTLIIEAGVIVSFQGHYKLNVDSSATLQAIGNQFDSISFSAVDTAIGWHGIRFSYSNSNSEISYCKIENGKANSGFAGNNGGAIYCLHSNPTIRNNSIINNLAVDLGGGIYCEQSSPSIIDNIFDWNSAYAGGGIDCEDNSNPLILNNTISNSFGVVHRGGGICCDNSSPIIDNNIITNNSSIYGGGVVCRHNSNPIIRNNSFIDNTATEGGGICCYYSAPEITNNIIRGNSVSQYGGGIQAYESEPTIMNNEIIGNSTEYAGAGISCTHSASPLIEENIIAKNHADIYAGGIYCSDSDPVISGNTIANNSSTYYAGGMYSTNSNSIVTRNIFWNDTALSGNEFLVPSGTPEITYCNIKGGWAGDGNINEDPLFCDTLNNDFHLDNRSECALENNDVQIGAFGIACGDYPGPFKLLAPSNSDTVWNLTADLIWEKSESYNSEDPITYNVYYDTLSDLSTANTIEDVLDTTYTLTSLMGGVRYYWTVKAENNNTDGSWGKDTLNFITYMPQPPQAFDLANPDNGATINSDVVTAVWHKAIDNDPVDSVLYEIFWSFDSTFGTYNNSITADTTFEIVELTSSLPDDNEIFWKVRVFDSFGYSKWCSPDSNGWSFNIYINDNPGPLSLLSPADSDTLWQLEATLLWSSAVNIDPGDSIWYEVYYDTLADLSTATIITDIADTSYQIATLRDDARYFWTIRAIDTNTNGTWGDDTSSFITYLPQPPQSFELTSPDNGAIINSDVVTAIWNKAIDIDPDDSVLYEIFWSFDSTFSTNNNSITADTTFEIVELTSSLPDDSVIFWKVRVFDSFGFSKWCSPDSNGWSFNIYINDNPGPLSLLSPANSDTLWQLEAKLLWSSAENIDPGDSIWYEVYYDTLADLSTATIIADLADTAYQTATLNDDTRYYWTIKAIDTNTNGRWSDDTMSFYTFLPELPSGFNLIYPAVNDVVESLDITFEWEMSLDPDPGDSVKYLMHFSFDHVLTTISPDTIWYDSSSVLAQVEIDNIGYDLSDGDTINWWITAESNLPDSSLECNERFVFIIPSFSGIAELVEIPENFFINQNYPNPFNPTTTISYGLDEPSMVRIYVFDIMGRQVASLVNRYQEAGFYSIDWNSGGNSSGIYFYKIQAGSNRETRKMTLLK